MFLGVRHRRSLASWLAAFVLLVQLVTAAYACPQAKAPAEPMPDDVMLMHDCDGDMHATMDPDQPQLCPATRLRTRQCQLDALGATLTHATSEHDAREASQSHGKPASRR
jgi:hypothetical protein